MERKNMICSLFLSSSLTKVLQVILTGSLKFFVAPFLAFNFNFSFIQIFITVAIGGILGVISFYILSEWLVEVFAKANPKIQFFIDKFRKKPRKPRKIFTKRNRLIVKTIKNYGLLGLVVLTPIFFTIPLGTFLTFRYFHHKENVLLYLSYSVIAWAFVLSGFVSFFNKGFS
ncbi:MAG: hypothetical protein WCK02_12610 [Bacteroidota bacterium]